MKLKHYKMNNLQLYNVEIEPIYEDDCLRTLILRADGEEIHIKASDYSNQLNVLTPDREEVETRQTSLRQIEHRLIEQEPEEAPSIFENEGIPF